MPDPSSDETPPLVDSPATSGPPGDDTPGGSGAFGDAVASRAATDRALVARMAGDDETDAGHAFDALFRAWYATLVRSAEGFVRERAVAEELAQDVMLAFWRSRQALVLSEPPGAYLVRAARNRALNHLRHRRVVDRTAPELLAAAESRSAPSAAAEVGAAELGVAVREAVAALPPRCREVFELSRGHGLTYTEIARTLDLSVKTVETQMGRALRMLRERLAPWMAGG